MGGEKDREEDIYRAKSFYIKCMRNDPENYLGYYGLSKISDDKHLALRTLSEGLIRTGDPEGNLIRSIVEVIGSKKKKFTIKHANQLVDLVKERVDDGDFNVLRIPLVTVTIEILLYIPTRTSLLTHNNLRMFGDDGPKQDTQYRPPFVVDSRIPKYINNEFVIFAVPKDVTKY